VKGILLAAALAGLPLAAQEHAAEKAHQEGDPRAVWKWANFAILAGGLGYLAVKGLGALFRSRSEEIRKDIGEARRTRQEAEQRAAEIDARAAALGEEIDQLRRESAAEMQRESQRLRQQTEGAILRVEQQAAAEIEAAGKTARRELKEYSAALALELAEQRLRARVDAAAEGVLIENFVSELSRRGPGT
jgi:F-type H+-transporting ATPase subunit b